MNSKPKLLFLAVFLGWLIVSCRPPAVETVIPRPEHPRPDFRREQWLNLNGDWEFRFDPHDHGIEEQWWNPGTPFDRRITVPYGWESRLSGIQETNGPQIGWYRREFRPPADWQGSRVWLRFEAVDWAARVWVNGTEMGSHEGGYTPFAFDITEQVQPGESATVVVRAFDPTDRHLPTGKQVAYWYTFTSGIWQTVWLEARPARYLGSLSLIPRDREGDWSLEVSATLAGLDGMATVRATSPDASVSSAQGEVEIDHGSGEFRAELHVESPQLWWPEDPNLYDLELRVADSTGATDVVHTYFGLRTIARGRHGKLPHESILLNGKPVYLRGALDQSFNPEGIYTAPSDEFLRRDMELAKSLGLNFLRIHIKPDEPRRLYWADKLGVLLMEDMPNTWDHSARARNAWEATLQEMIARDRNHPAIISWVLFNETWGLGGYRNFHEDYRNNRETQQWVLRMWEEVKETLDPTRLVEDNSPNGKDHVKTDLNSWHFYIDDYERSRSHIEEVVAKTFPGSKFNYLPDFRQGTAPLINSEYGAVSASGGDRDISWGFRYLTTQLRRHEKIQGYIYTELTDIEFEHNGFLNYDRSPKQFGYDAFVPEMRVADLQRADFIGFDAPPALETEPGSTVSVPIFVSHFSDLEKPPTLHTWITGLDDLGRDFRVEGPSRSVQWERYRVIRQRPLEMTLPEGRNFVGALGMEMVDDSGQRLAANFVNLIARDKSKDSPLFGSATPPSSPRVEVLEPRRVALRVAPYDFATSHWEGTGSPALFYLRSTARKFFGYGSGKIEYRVEVPQSVLDATPTGLEFLAELATKARHEKLAWPQQTRAVDYPQTDAAKFPGTVHLKIGGHELAPIELPDDPADARGVLSHQAAFHHGSYGYLIRRKLDRSSMPDLAERLRRHPVLRIIFEVPRGRNAHGLSIFGEHTGSFPLDPTVIIETKQSVSEPQ